MGKHYCDYCDVFLTHDSASVRKAHNSGRNHLANVRDYYASLGHDKAQNIIDEITRMHETGGTGRMRYGVFNTGGPLAPGAGFSGPITSSPFGGPPGGGPGMYNRGPPPPNPNFFPNRPPPHFQGPPPGYGGPGGPPRGLPPPMGGYNRPPPGPPGAAPPGGGYGGPPPPPPPVMGQQGPGGYPREPPPGVGADGPLPRMQ